MNRELGVKILVVGDSGVGKSQLVTILTDKDNKNSQSKWTIGANTEIAVHIYKQGIPHEEATYLIELWDISGNQAHKNSRSVYYKG